MHNVLKKIATVLLAIVVTLGWKYYAKSSHASDYKKELVSLCSQDRDCVEAVNENFDSCYDDHYSIGGRHTNSKLNLESFASCLNEKSGQMYFSIKNSSEENQNS